MRKLLIPLALMFSVNAFGQLAVTNNGNLTIHSGALVSIAGNFTNTSSASLINNGILYAKSAITNDQSAMSVGAGTLHLNAATGLQTISGSQPFKTLDLNTNNSYGIVLNNNLEVSGVHTFTSGIITTSATPNFLVYENGSSYTGDDDSRHVDGWVKKIGTSNFVFPVGNASMERAIAMNSLSATSEFNVRYKAATPYSNQVQAPLVNVDPFEYWMVNKISGDTATLTLNWDNSKVAFPNWPVADIRTSNYNGSYWTDQGGTATGNTGTTGIITSNNISSFNLITFASRAFPLPLMLIHFSATRLSDCTQITWRTELEQDINNFSVERSNDGIHFYSIDKIAARNTSTAENYLTKDYTPINKVAFYRLRSIETNGSEKLSAVVIVRITAGTCNLILVTNPVTDKIILSAKGNMNGLFDYNIYEMNGQVIQKGKLPIQNDGQYKLSLKDQHLQGAYILVVSNSQQRYIFKLSVNN